ncbi:protein MTSS 1-like [Protopterus annectens]|uniref:protein MTSS 1-like n=1 Tax=Protopterus annectens TaxID=7888 RepID=UPI001CFB977C|nr:protein MTSS 1-like [Protopterus annectens]
MDAGMERECSALGGLFQTIMNDMKASYPTWEDFISKAAKLQSQLRTTVIVTSTFLDAFQKIADMAINTRGATKEIGSALTRMCMRHRSIESRMKQFTGILTDSLINPLEVKIEEWKKVASQMDKDHAKEYKKARAELKKKSSDTLKLQKKAKKGKDSVLVQLDSALQDVNEKYLILEETEKKAVYRALTEERGRFCSFVGMLKPVLDEEIGMLGEITHLQTILEDLTTLTADPAKLPPSSEQVISDIKGSDFNYSYQTPPGSPSSSMSRKASVNSNFYSASIRHVPSMDSISSSMEGLFLRPPSVIMTDGASQKSTSSLSSEASEACRSVSECSSPTSVGSGCATGSWAGNKDQQVTNNQQKTQGYPNGENATTASNPSGGYQHTGDRARAMTANALSKPQVGEMSARDHLALALGQGLIEAQRSSRDSLHCSSGYSTQTTTPSCSEDTIPSQAVKKGTAIYEYDYISLHGDQEASDQVDFDKSSTIPRNSDISQNYRKMFQTKRPASTVSLIADTEPAMRSPQVATIRRKPSSKPPFRRGTVSGVPIPIRTPVVPLKPSSTSDVSGSQTAGEEMVNVPTEMSDLYQVKQGLCGSTRSLSTIHTPYYSLIPSHSYSSARHQHPSLQQVFPSISIVNSVAAKKPPLQSSVALHLQRIDNIDSRSDSSDLQTTEPDTSVDMLAMIRRGVKLRKTISNDRSAPQIK